MSGSRFHVKLTVQLSVLLLAVLISCKDELGEDGLAGNPLPSTACNLQFLFGYTNKVSYYPGETMQVFMQAQSEESACRLDIYTLSGEVAFSAGVSLRVQVVGENPSRDGFGFTHFSKVFIPKNLKSGVYLIEKSIPIIVKTNFPVDLTVVYPSNTANAYETSGGKSFYSPSPSERSNTVSFHRPIMLQSLSEHCLRWFAQLSHLEIGYIADIDLDDYENFERGKVLVLPGHSEYWTRAARINFDKFINSGKHAIILSGNTMWWQARYSDDGNSLICYKDASLDPETDPALKTITWNSPSLQFSIIHSIGADFERGGYGLRQDSGWNGYEIVNSKSPLLEGLTLTEGSEISLPSLEYDGAPIKSFDVNGFPLIDNDILKFHKVELIGFDKGFRVTETVGTFIVFQKAPTSGIIVNTASTDWCGSNGMGGVDGDKIKTITLNAINKLVNNKPVFTE